MCSPSSVSLASFSAEPTKTSRPSRQVSPPKSSRPVSARAWSTSCWTRLAVVGSTLMVPPGSPNSSDLVGLGAAACHESPAPVNGAWSPELGAQALADRVEVVGAERDLPRHEDHAVGAERECLADFGVEVVVHSVEHD